MKIIIFIAAIILSPSYVTAGWFGPSTYEECVLKNVKGVKSDMAARLVANVCREQFPKPMADEEFNKIMGRMGAVVQPRNLSSDEVAKISIDTTNYHSYGNSYDCNIYNGNTSVSGISSFS